MTLARRKEIKELDTELEGVLDDLNNQREKTRKMSILTLMRVAPRTAGDELGNLYLISTSTGYYGLFSGAPSTALIIEGRLPQAELDELKNSRSLILQGSNAKISDLHWADFRRPRVWKLSVLFGFVTLAASLFATIRMMPASVREHFRFVDVDASQSGFDSFFQTAPMMAAGAAALYLTVFTLYSGMHQQRMERPLGGLARGLKGLVEHDGVLLRWCLMALACSSLGYLIAMSPDPLLWFKTQSEGLNAWNCGVLVLACLRGLGASLLVTLSTMMLVPPFHDLIHFLVGRNIDHLALQALKDHQVLVKQQTNPGMGSQE